MKIREIFNRNCLYINKNYGSKYVGLHIPFGECFVNTKVCIVPSFLIFNKLMLKTHSLQDSYTLKKFLDKSWLSRTRAQDKYKIKIQPQCTLKYNRCLYILKIRKIIYWNWRHQHCNLFTPFSAIFNFFKIWMVKISYA